MHEYHKAVEWVEKANSEAAAAGAAKVAALKVTFGEASDYSPEVVKNYFDEAAVGTACEGARFDVTITRCMLKCPQCGRLFEKKLLMYECPDCGVEGNPTDSGNEVELTGVELTRI
jgi:hydrogenase nickel incorporation protein HypA/HybF